jgi:hypothetical protein
VSPKGKKKLKMGKKNEKKKPQKKTIITITIINSKVKKK